jgi:hypothetical protein
MTMASVKVLDSEASSRSVVDRALSILGTFQGNRSRQALSDISRNSGLPIATCYRIVQRLVEWGALERDGENRYRIGLRLWEVASRAPPTSPSAKAPSSCRSSASATPGAACGGPSWAVATSCT